MFYKIYLNTNLYVTLIYQKNLLMAKLNFSDNIICSIKSFINKNDIISIVSNYILKNIKIFSITLIRVCFIESRI